MGAQRISVIGADDESKALDSPVAVMVFGQSFAVVVHPVYDNGRLVKRGDPVAGWFWVYNHPMLLEFDNAPRQSQSAGLRSH